MKFKKIKLSIARFRRAYHTYRHARIMTWSFLSIVFLVLVFFLMIRPPSNFPVGQMITIPDDVSVTQTGTILKGAHVIRSVTMFKVISKVFFLSRPIYAGDYQFEKRKNILQVVRAVTHGIFGNVRIRITLFEGSTIKEIAATMQGNIPGFDADTFIKEAAGKEGYLFPDTYLFFRSVAPETVLEILTNQYKKKLESLHEQITQSKKTEQEIIIMASILEKEARDGVEAKVISGILWKRIRIGMPLQVDAPFLYTLGKTSAQLTLDNLRQDGPYNTYTRKGLPPGPIGNPGLTMIDAALNPIASPYLFYLHDRAGNIYYAKTNAEHVANKQKYLR